MPGFPGLKESFYIHEQLLKKYLPKLYTHLQKEGIIPEVYCTNWYMTMFVVYFPIEVVVRIWDVYLVEGRKTIFRLSLAIMKINEEALLKGDISESFSIFKEY